jgi:uncharacterized protein (DUF2267 family)
MTFGRRERTARRDSSKAADDRHIGFRWLAREAGLPGERDAEEVFRAVARELGECVGGDEARHLASHLPLGLRLIWEEETRRDGPPHFLGRDELTRRLQRRLGLAYEAEAEILLTIVCDWLRHLAPEERDDVAAVLSPGLRELWDQARVPVLVPWRRLAIPASPTL